MEHGFWCMLLILIYWEKTEMPVRKTENIKMLVGMLV